MDTDIIQKDRKRKDGLSFNSCTKLGDKNYRCISHINLIH